MTSVFVVVGAHRDDPDRLLLLGDDGLYYACFTPADPPFPVELDAEWVLDAAPAAEAAAVPAARVSSAPSSRPSFG